MDEILNEVSSQTAIPWQVWSMRLLGTVVLCGLLGFEREIDHRPAGLRTHMLIGLASALYCLVMLELVHSPTFNDEQVRTDPIRIVEAVTQGVAFLAAGIVVFTKGRCAASRLAPQCGCRRRSALPARWGSGRFPRRRPFLPSSS